MKKGKHRTPNNERRTPNFADDALESMGGYVLCEAKNGRIKFNLEERLLEFASAVIDLSEMLPNTRAGNHVAGQILRSGTSPFPNHAEAESAESHEDFIHKFKICLKELRETRRWARLIQRKTWAEKSPTLLFVLSESDELIRIFMASIRTARQNALLSRRKVSERVSYA
ncbi:MAG TPA: four helix bundle protein, partial [Verrucomicrobiae bacterium]